MRYEVPFIAMIYKKVSRGAPIPVLHLVHVSGVKAPFIVHVSYISGTWQSCLKVETTTGARPNTEVQADRVVQG